MYWKWCSGLQEHWWSFSAGSAVGVHLIFLLQIYTCMLHTFYILLIFYNLSKTQWAGGRCLLVYLAPCKEYLPLEPACLCWSSYPGPCWLLWPVRPWSELALMGLMSHLRASGAQWPGHTEEQEMSLGRLTQENSGTRTAQGSAGHPGDKSRDKKSGFRRWWLHTDPVTLQTQ